MSDRNSVTEGIKLCDNIIKTLLLFGIVKPEDLNLVRLLGYAVVEGGIIVTEDTSNRIGMDIRFISKVLPDRAELFRKIVSNIRTQELWLWGESDRVWLSATPPCVDLYEILSKLWNIYDESKYSLYALYNLEFVYKGSIPVEEMFIESLRKDATNFTTKMKEGLEGAGVLCIPEFKTYNTIRVPLSEEVMEHFHKCVSASVMSLERGSSAFIESIGDCLMQKSRIRAESFIRLTARDLSMERSSALLYYFLSRLSKSNERIRLESTKYVFGKIVLQYVPGGPELEGVRDKIWEIISAIIGTEGIQDRIRRVLRLLEDLGQDESWLSNLNSYLVREQIPEGLPVGDLRYLVGYSLQTLAVLSVLSAIFERVAPLDSRMRELIERYNTIITKLTIKPLKLDVEPSQGLVTYIAELVKFILNIERDGIKLPKTAKFTKTRSSDVLIFDGDGVILSRDYIIVKRPVGKGREYYLAVRATSTYSHVIRHTYSLIRELEDLERSTEPIQRRMSISKMKRSVEELHQTILRDILVSKDGKYQIEVCPVESEKIIICKVSASD